MGYILSCFMYYNVIEANDNILHISSNVIINQVMIMSSYCQIRLCDSVNHKGQII